MQDDGRSGAVADENGGAGALQTFFEDLGEEEAGFLGFVLWEETGQWGSRREREKEDAPDSE